MASVVLVGDVQRLGKRGESAANKYIRRLHDLVHALRTQSALDQIADCYGANKGSETGILALLLCRAVLEDLGWAEGRLRGDFVSIAGWERREL